ncbi:hypothetical protein N7540_008017 [Penicillium herquei]|nr:hypothetical protein N7540_008017 [Penicillium herquei]
MEDPNLQTAVLDNRPLAVIAVEPVNKYHDTVRRLRLAEPDLPECIIVKQKKEGWDEEFQNEIYTYSRLKKLQGNLIRTFLGQGFFDDCPAIFITNIEGMTLLQLATKSNVTEETLEFNLPKP